MLKHIDASTNVMLFVPHLTPKEAAKFLASSKALHNLKDVAKPLSVSLCAERWLAGFKPFSGFEKKAIAESIGKSLTVHYPKQILLRTIITLREFRWGVENDGKTINRYSLEYKVKFFKQKKLEYKAVSIVCFTQTCLKGVNELPPVFNCEENF